MDTQKIVLTASKLMDVRFNEVDSMNIVWHGNYVKYFEDAREAFGTKFSLGYLDMYRAGFYAPIVKMDLQYKSPLVFGDSFTVQATYVPCAAAKLMFDYRIISERNGKVAATGSSVQIFMDMEYRLILYTPDFILQWRKNHGVEV